MLVVVDRVACRVEPREQVQRRLGLDAGHAGNRREQVVREVALAGEPAARRDQVVDALVAAERGLDRELAGHVGAQAHRGEDVQALDVVLRVALVARDHHPARAVAAGAVVLRQAVEGDEQHVVGERGDRRVRGAVVEHLVVDLVGEDDQLVAPGDLDDLPQQVRRIQRAGRIVRVDDHDRARALGDLAARCRRGRAASPRPRRRGSAAPCRRRG